MVFQVMVMNLWPQNGPHHHANRATCTTFIPLPQSPLTSPLFLLTPRKATMALALEFDLGWGAEKGGWGMKDLEGWG